VDDGGLADHKTILDELADVLPCKRGDSPHVSRADVLKLGEKLFLGFSSASPPCIMTLLFLQPMELLVAPLLS
jgi:hypothetical protein